MDPNVAKLVEVIKPFPPRLKKAMFAAASKGLIAQGTWVNCAFNAAGKEELGKSYVGSTTMAGIFQVSPRRVSHFISVWDTLPIRNETATEALKQAILEVGLNSEPPGAKKGGILRRESRMVYKSKMEELDNEFQSMLNGITDEFFQSVQPNNELVSDAQEIASFLVSA